VGRSRWSPNLIQNRFVDPFILHLIHILPPHPISPSSFTLLLISETSIVAAYLTHLKRGIPIRAQRSTTSLSTITHLPIATMSYPVTPSIERTQDEMMASPRIQSADSPPMSPQMEQADIQSKHTTGMSPLAQIRNSD
jgi:hypothetical protein